MRLTPDRVTPQMVTNELLATLERIQASAKTPGEKMLAVEAAEADAATLHQLVRERTRYSRIRGTQPQRRQNQQSLNNDAPSWAV